LFVFGAGEDVIDDGTEFCGGDGDGGVGGTVVEIEGVFLPVNGYAGREDNVGNVACSFIGFLGAEDPFVTSSNYFPGLIEVEQCQAEPVNGTGGGYSDAVVEDKPAVTGFDRLARQSDAVGVPICGSCFYEGSVVSPVLEVW